MRRIVALAFSIALFASAQSQPPAETPVTGSETKQSKKTNKNSPGNSGNGLARPDPSATNQKGSGPVREDVQEQGTKKAQSAPVQPVVVNVNVPKSDFNWTDLLIAAFTGLLVWVGYLQRKTLQAHHDVMKISADAAKSSAETLALQRGVIDTQAGYIGGLLAETRKSADAAASSAATAQRALYISQRPLITVDVSMAGGIHEQPWGTSEMDKLRDSFVRVVFRNAGNTVAKEFYFAFWITGEHGRHLICDSHRKPMTPGEIIEETTKKLASFMDPIEIVGFNVQTVKVCGFARYKTLFDELPGVYIEFHALWDKSIRQFRISAEEREDGSYPEPS